MFALQMLMGLERKNTWETVKKEEPLEKQGLTSNLFPGTPIASS